MRISSSDGVGFDGSSIRGFQAIDESDMLMMPDPTTARIDPYTAVPTMYVVCDIYDPITRERYDRDPRGVAQRAEAYLKSTGIGDTAYMGPEPEFFVFDNVRYDITNDAQLPRGRFRSRASGTPARDEGHGNLGYKIRPKAGYYPGAAARHAAWTSAPRWS